MSMLDKHAPNNGRVSSLHPSCRSVKLSNPQQPQTYESDCKTISAIVREKEEPILDTTQCE